MHETQLGKPSQDFLASLTQTEGYMCVSSRFVRWDPGSIDVKGKQIFSGAALGITGLHSNRKNAESLE